MKSKAQARRDDPERVKREFKQVWDEFKKRPEAQAAFKRLDDAGNAEEKLRRLLKGFVSFDNPYSMDVLEVYAQKHFQCSAKQFVWNTDVIDSCAHLDVQLSDPAFVLAEELRRARVRPLVGTLRTEPNSIASRVKPQPYIQPVGRNPSQQIDGEKLKAYRNRAGISQEKLAEFARVGPATIQRYEAGKGCSNPIALAEALTRALARKTGEIITEHHIIKHQK